MSSHDEKDDSVPVAPTELSPSKRAKLEGWKALVQRQIARREERIANGTYSEPVWRREKRLQESLRSTDDGLEKED